MEVISTLIIIMLCIQILIWFYILCINMFSLDVWLLEKARYLNNKWAYKKFALGLWVSRKIYFWKRKKQFK